jgi:hypothetical protein
MKRRILYDGFAEDQKRKDGTAKPNRVSRTPQKVSVNLHGTQTESENWVSQTAPETSPIDIEVPAGQTRSSNVTKIRNLILHNGAKLEASALTSIDGCVILHTDAELVVPALTRIARDVSLYQNTNMFTPELVEVVGYISVGNCASVIAPALSSVGGYVSIYPDATLEAVWLTTIHRSLTLFAGAALDVPKLAYVGHNLRLGPNACLLAPELHHVGGRITRHSSSSLVSNNLEVAEMPAPKLGPEGDSSQQTSLGGIISTTKHLGHPAGSAIKGNLQKLKNIKIQK